MSERVGTMRFTLDVGLLNRSLLAEIKKICWKHGMEVKIDKLDSGWLSSSYGIEVKGDEIKLKALDATIKGLVDDAK